MANPSSPDTLSAGQIRCVVEGSTGWLLVDNPAKLNAMSLAMFKQLREHVTRLEDDPAVRCVILRGADGKAFCSGGDISEFEGFRTGPEGIAAYGRVGNAALETLRTCPKPTIAMIEGYCMGGGVALALNCDLRIASQDARLGIPAAKRGLSYDFADIKLLVDLIGPSATKNMLYTGRAFSAEEALRIGLINELASVDELKAKVMKISDTIAANAPLSIAAAKFIVDTATTDPEKRDLHACEAHFTKCMTSEDFAEANQAFAEKRRPAFKGR